MSAIPRTTTESLHYGDHRWAIRVNGAGESHWSMSHGPENIYSDRRCNFCCSSVAPPVASLHGVASYDRRLDSADVGKLDCFRRSGRLELLRIKTSHAASLIVTDCLAALHRRLTPNVSVGSRTTDLQCSHNVGLTLNSRRNAVSQQMTFLTHEENPPSSLAYTSVEKPIDNPVRQET